MKKDVALIIVFNHRYDKNLDILDKIYQDRFSNIYYLVPFYDGNKQNVIPVYESSYYFQGYFVQGFQRYFEERYLHYFFLADDMMLNPAINENNYQEYFKLSETTSFIPEVYSLNKINDNNLYCSPGTIWDGIAKVRGKEVKKWWWCRVVDAYNFKPKSNGIEASGALPSTSEAELLLKRHGVDTTELTYSDIFGGPKVPLSFKTLLPNLEYVLYHEILRLKYKLPYPLTGAYSDIVIVSHQSIKKFIHYCGLFAASSLFVELAVPTALLFASDDVVTEPQIGKRGLIFWPQSKKRNDMYEQEMQKFNYEVDNLINNFPENTLYLHPIKLSKWKLSGSAQVSKQA